MTKDRLVASQSIAMPAAIAFLKRLGDILRKIPLLEIFKSEVFVQKYAFLAEIMHPGIMFSLAINCEISHILCVGTFGETDNFLTVSKREKEISVSLPFPRENCPFPLNFHAQTIEKFRYFLLQLHLVPFRESFADQINGHKNWTKGNTNKAQVTNTISFHERLKNLEKQSSLILTKKFFIIQYSHIAG